MSKITLFFLLPSQVDNADYVERVLKSDPAGGGGGGKKEKPPAGSREKRDGSADRRKRKEVSFRHP